MITDTTISIHHDTYEKLTAAAKLTGISRSQLISSLLNHASKKMLKLQADWIRVRYQERRVGETPGRVHVRVRRDEFEFYFDLKKVVRLSLSHLIAYATENYIDEIVGLLLKDADNYRYRNYIITQLFVDDVECWMIYWGIPREIHTAPPPAA